MRFGLGGKAGESTVKNFLEIVNLRFTIFSIYDFYECHYLDFCCHIYIYFFIVTGAGAPQ